LRTTARYLFFSALLVAPWLYGGTTATSIVVINWLLGAALLFALPSYFVNTAVFGGWPQALLAYPRMYAALLLWGLLMLPGVGNQLVQRGLNNSTV